MTKTLRFLLKKMTVASLILLSTYCEPISFDAPHYVQCRILFATRIEYWQDGIRHNAVTVDLHTQLWKWFPKVFSHPRRFPRGSC